jgi:hypothetical protein
MDSLADGGTLPDGASFRETQPEIKRIIKRIGIDFIKSLLVVLRHFK